MKQNYFIIGNVIFLLCYKTIFIESNVSIPLNSKLLKKYKKSKPKYSPLLEPKKTGLDNKRKDGHLLDYKKIRGGNVEKKLPSIYWAVLHNWIYFLSLGFNAINVPFMIRQIVDGNTKINPSPQSIALSGRVESVDRILTFLGVGYLSALSDKFGRKPLMAWSALGFMITNLIQANAGSSIAALYLADFVDGCSSCMFPLCQAYIIDVSETKDRATNLGIFQGLSAAGAFIIAFPVGGVLGAKYGPRLPLLIAAVLQAINALIILTVTPESNSNPKPTLKLTDANPLKNLVRLFGHDAFLRTASILYLLINLARGSLDAQFTNYTNIRFGWSQAQSGPLLVVVGLLLAINPRLLVPRLGLKNSILAGLLIFAAGLIGTGLAATPSVFVAFILIVSVGCVASPAITALLANLAPANERGALLGAVASLLELIGAIASTLYACILAKFMNETTAPLKIPGMHFLVGSFFLLLAWAIAFNGFKTFGDHDAFKSVSKEAFD